MNFEEYQIAAARIWGHTRLDDPVIGLAGEVGEVLEIIKKDRRPGTFRKPLKRENLVKEIGDVLYYLTIIAEENNIDLEECAVGNIDKLSERYKGVLESRLPVVYEGIIYMESSKKDHEKKLIEEHSARPFR